jgi:Ubiquitin-like autophagy protein Apg12
MTEEAPTDESMGVDKLSLQAEKPTETVKSEKFSKFSCIFHNFHALNILVDILLNAAGNAAIMKKRKWTVDWMKDINWVSKFIHKYLKLEPEEKLVS